MQILDHNKTPAQAFTPPAKKKHVRTGLEIFFWGGGGHESARTSGGRLHALWETLKNRVFLMPFPAFWSEFYA